MGLFSKPIVTCGVCGREVGTKEKRWTTKDGFLCPDCQKPFGILNGSKAFVKYSSEQLKEMKTNRENLNNLLSKNRELYNSFTKTRIIENTLFIDDTKENWYFDSGKNGIIDINGNIPVPYVFNFSDVLGVYTALGGKTIKSTSSTRKEKGVRNAIAGSLIAGNTGALLGGMLSKTTTVTQATEFQNVYVNVIIDATQEPISMPYPNENAAEKVRLVLASMINDAIEESPQADSKISTADEIRKFKALLEDGIITEDEFIAKKKQLLDL
jgi:hypothetical protein